CRLPSGTPGAAWWAGPTPPPGGIPRQATPRTPWLSCRWPCLYPLVPRRSPESGPFLPHAHRSGQSRLVLSGVRERKALPHSRPSSVPLRIEWERQSGVPDNRTGGTEMFRRLWERARRLFSPAVRESELREHLDALRQRAPVPVLWLFGKTQSGKTSLVRYLTGAARAEIGKGYQPCTRFSSRYNFPSEQAPLLSFLDTRGLDEPGYDAGEDIAKFGEEAHVVLVTVKVL